MNGERAKDKKLLSDALDHIDDAIQLLREYASKCSGAEFLEDVLYLLEEAGEALERALRELELES